VQKAIIEQPKEWRNEPTYGPLVSVADERARPSHSRGEYGEAAWIGLGMQFIKIAPL
jgi:hypothetical protein